MHGAGVGAFVIPIGCASAQALQTPQSRPLQQPPAVSHRCFSSMGMEHIDFCRKCAITTGTLALSAAARRLTSGLVSDPARSDKLVTPHAIFRCQRSIVPRRELAEAAATMQQQPNKTRIAIVQTDSLHTNKTYIAAKHPFYLAL